MPEIWQGPWPHNRNHFPANSAKPIESDSVPNSHQSRPRNVLTVLGPVLLSRPYYVCADCSQGQYPADAALGVTGLESSPGMRRMEAVVGSEMPFAPGCEPIKLLAGLDVTAKAIERTAEAIGTQIAQRDEQEIGRAKQLVLPVVSKQNMAKMLQSALSNQILRRYGFFVPSDLAAD